MQTLLFELKIVDTVDCFRPCKMFWNRLEHESIEVKEAIRLTADEMIVVYRQNGHKSERRLVYGPIVFFPDSNEW
jgi:hypothetical protein